MRDHDKAKPQGRNGQTIAAAEQRRDRLAEELRANLRKRKALARKRQGADDRATDDGGQPDGA